MATDQKSILVIGGSRFVGPYIIEMLLEKGHKVTVFHRGEIQKDYKERVSFIQGDRHDGFSISEHFNAVIDTCAYTGSDTKSAIQQLKFDFFLHVGTVAAYQKTQIFPLTETSPLGEWPLFVEYNQGKVECERMLEESGIKYAVIRPVYILGPKNPHKREEFIYAALKQGIPVAVPGNGQAVVQFVFAKEVASSIVLLAEQQIQGAFNCAGDNCITLQGLVDEQAKIIGCEAQIGFGGGDSGFPFANENFFCSNKKIKKLGVTFTPLSEGLREDYESYYKNII